MPQRRPGRPRKPQPVTLAGPTAQRLQHAVAAGQTLAVEEYQTDAGEQTQLQRVRIVSPLERIWKAGLIGSGQYGAAMRYKRDADMVDVAGAAQTVRYDPRWIDAAGERFLLPMEAAADHIRRLVSAQGACGQQSQRMLDWIATEPMGWRKQAEEWFGTFSKDAVQRIFLSLLRGTCDSLESHYRRST